ncbi:MAG: type II secretion system GspH family protein [Phycisphaerales bacterium]|nr:type II secretion system GspH family protein [Phycisphaerales bacterium]
MELLVVIAMVGVLTAIVVPAATSLQGTAQMADELSIARRTTQAWRNWSMDHAGRLLPGQVELSEDLPPSEAPVQINGVNIPEIARRRWLWRLHSYFDDPVQTLWGGSQRSWREQVMEGSGDPTTKLYVATLHPTLGLNAEWIGGRQSGDSDTWSLTQYGQSVDPLTPPVFADALSQLRRPADLVLFASARGQADASGGQTIEGWWRVEPPYRPGVESGQVSWATTEAGGFIVPGPEDAPADSGFVSARHDGRTVIARPDGSVKAESFDRLGDMRRWAPDATTSEWSPTLPGF